MSILDDLAHSYQSQLLSIRAEHGAAWTVFIDDRVEAAFDAFEAATEYAFHKLGDREYLIRHTFEQPEFVPFMIVAPR